MRLITVEEFRKRYFVSGSEPDTRTIRAWIDKGELIGRVVGKLYYVDLDRWETNTGNPLVDKVLRNGTT